MQMAKLYPFRLPRRLADPHAVAERLAIWSEEARRAGRLERADRLLFAAWTTYDLPATVVEHREASAEVIAIGRGAVCGGTTSGDHDDWERMVASEERRLSTAH